VILHFERHDPRCNVARFYRLEVAPTLFGDWSLVRIWGRIGTRGRLHMESYHSRDVALAAARKLKHTRQRRGYNIILEQGLPRQYGEI
jgi:predicted DNA-binding WGR domain protein